MTSQMLEYYDRELRYVRELGGEFAREHPKVAGRLGLDSFACADPYVERLLEGFAFLAARVQLKIDDEFPRFSEQLLGLVCPHYLQPTPSMAIVEFCPDERHAGLNSGSVLPRGTSLRAPVPATDVECEFRTAHEVTLWPIEVASLELAPAAGSLDVASARGRPTKGMLQLRLRTTNGMPFSRVALDAVTLFLRGSDAVPWRLFETLVTGATGISTRTGPRGPWSRLAGAKVVPVGLDDADALLPTGARSFQGYRLLHEYFAFPARLLFVRLEGLRDAVRACEGHEIDLAVALDRVDPRMEGAVSASSVSLFSAPAVNLFPLRADRVEVTAASAEHHVVLDRAHPADFEVHSILSVTGYGSRGEALHEFRPFYRHRLGQGDTPAFFTVSRRERRASRVGGQKWRSAYAGSEVFLSLVDGSCGPFGADLRQLGVEARCTNRDLPMRLATGLGATDFVVDAGGPILSARCIAGPSAPRPCIATGETTWRLISHLSLNYLTVTDDAEGGGAVALRELLALYADLSALPPSSVRSVVSRPVVRRLPVDGPPTFARGLELTVECDESTFATTGAFALGAVLARFFARYVSVNSFVETVLRSTQRGEIARWPWSLGRRPML